MTDSELKEQIEVILSNANDTERFAEVLKSIVTKFAAHMGTIHRLDAADGHLHLVAATEGLPEPVLAASRRIPLGKGIAGECAQTARPVTLCNLQTDKSGSARPGARATGAQGAICVPVWNGPRVIGTLGIGCMGERVFSEAETKALIDAGRAIAPHLIIAVR